MTPATACPAQHHRQIEKQGKACCDRGAQENPAGAEICRDQQSDADHETGHQEAGFDGGIATDIALGAVGFQSDLQQSAQQKRYGGKGKSEGGTDSDHADNCCGGVQGVGGGEMVAQTPAHLSTRVIAGDRRFQPGETEDVSQCQRGNRQGINAVFFRRHQPCKHSHGAETDNGLCQLYRQIPQKMSSKHGTLRSPQRGILQIRCRLAGEG